jgi:hypothetical protein
LIYLKKSKGRSTLNAGQQNKNKSKNSLVRECALPYVLVKFEKVELRKFRFSTISELQSNFPIGYVVCTRIEELTRKKEGLRCN